MTPLLQIDHVTHYFGGLCAVNDFNLELNKGELVGIIGPNGAGKTTIFNLITGVYKATKGSIKLNGEELVGMKPNQITTKGIARTFQNIRLFKDLTVLDNVRIAFYGQLHTTPVSALLGLPANVREEQRISDKAMDLLAIFKLDGLAGETSRNLPYGQQRRLEIARALATEPQLLCLDEPAAGMNATETGELRELIEGIRGDGTTVLLIEHDVKLVMGLCDRVAVFDYGALVIEDVPAVVQKDQRVIEAYLGG